MRAQIYSISFFHVFVLAPIPKFHLCQPSILSLHHWVQTNSMAVLLSCFGVSFHRQVTFTKYMTL